MKNEKEIWTPELLAIDIKHLVLKEAAKRWKHIPYESGESFQTMLIDLLLKTLPDEIWDYEKGD